MNNVLNVIEATSHGLGSRDGIVLAAEGTFKRTMFGYADGKPLGAGRVVTEFSTAYRDLLLNLSDAKYRELTSMDVPDGTTVFDRIAGTTYRKGEKEARLPFQGDVVADHAVETLGMRSGSSPAPQTGQERGASEPKHSAVQAGLWYGGLALFVTATAIATVIYLKRKLAA